MAIVTAPTNHTGRVAGVDLVDGTGNTTNPNALAYFRRHPEYVVTDEPAAPEPDEPPATKPGRKTRRAAAED